MIINNQTMSLLPADLLFSMDRAAAIFSLLFILVIILVVILLLFYHQRNASVFDEHELCNDPDVSSTENKALHPITMKQYASVDKNPSMMMTTTDIDEEMTRSTTNLISSK